MAPSRSLEPQDGQTLAPVPGAGGLNGGLVVVDIAPGDFAYLENTIDNTLAFLEAEMNALGCG